MNVKFEYQCIVEVQEQFKKLSGVKLNIESSTLLLPSIDKELDALTLTLAKTYNNNLILPRVNSHYGKYAELRTFHGSALHAMLTETLPQNSIVFRNMGNKEFTAEEFVSFLMSTKTLIEEYVGHEVSWERWVELMHAIDILMNKNYGMAFEPYNTPKEFLPEMEALLNAGAPLRMSLALTAFDVSPADYLESGLTEGAPYEWIEALFGIPERTSTFFHL